MQQTIPVIIIGGGQAGLSVSYLLKQREIDHIIFERSTIAHAWKNQRWDSFCLVTPNWQCALPGFPYPGNDPQGFMVRDQIAAGELEALLPRWSLQTGIIHAVIPSRRGLAHAVRSFIDFLVEEFARDATI